MKYELYILLYYSSTISLFKFLKEIKEKRDSSETQENQPCVRIYNHEIGTDDARGVVPVKESDEGPTTEAVTENEVSPTGVEDEAGAEGGEIGTVIREGP